MCPPFLWGVGDGRPVSSVVTVVAWPPVLLLAANWLSTALVVVLCM